MPIRTVLFSLFLSFFLVTANAVAVDYDIFEGEVNTSLPFSPTEVFVSGNKIQAGAGAQVIHEDGSTGKYFEAAAALREDVRVNGPRRVIVYKYPGGASFAWIRILPRR